MGGGMGGVGMSDIRVKHDIVLLGHLDNGSASIASVTMEVTRPMSA